MKTKVLEDEKPPVEEFSAKDHTGRDFRTKIRRWTKSPRLIETRFLRDAAITELEKSRDQNAALQQELEKAEVEVSGIEKACFEKSGTRTEYEQAVASDKSLQ